jgi:hypothetical protein
MAKENAQTSASQIGERGDILAGLTELHLVSILFIGSSCGLGRLPARNA